jgi:hypothetical protein
MKRLITTSLILFAAFVLSVPLMAQDAAPDNKEDKTVESYRRQIDQAVERGLAWLAANQAKNGSFGQGYVVASTSMAGLGFLSHGHVPGRGKYGKNVTKAIEYMLRNQGRSGYITEHNGGASRMHGHGYATLFLAEAYGMTQNIPGIEADKLKEAVQKAVDVIEASQSTLGGWYYMPSDGKQANNRDEGSITVTILEGLRSARNAGITVQDETIDKAVEYMRKSANPDGTFKYSLGMGNNRGSFALCCAGLSVLNFLGTYEGEEVENALNYMMTSLEGNDQGTRGRFYYYEMYYAGIALHQAGGDYWTRGFPVVLEDLLSKQNTDGSFAEGRDTALNAGFALIVLSLPDHLLPIHQK